MFENFKRANSSVHADADLADRIIEKNRELENRKAAENVHNKALFPLKRSLPAIAAAAVVISTSLTLLPRLNDKDTNDIIYTTQTTALPTAAADENTTDSDILTTVTNETADSTASADTTATPLMQSAPKKDSSANETAKSKAVPMQMAAPKTTSAPVQTYAPKATPVPIQMSTPENGRSYSFESEKAENPEYSFASENTDTVPNARSMPVPETPKHNEAVLNFNSPQNFTYPETAAYLGGELFAGELSYADWSYARYFEYLGTDFNLWRIPSDLTLLGHGGDLLGESFVMAQDAYGKPAFDTRIFAYEGENGRYLSLQTSKDINTVAAYLSDTALAKSRIGETEAVIIGTAESWHCYLISGSTAYTITGDNITENELKELLCSIL